MNDLLLFKREYLGFREYRMSLERRMSQDDLILYLARRFPKMSFFTDEEYPKMICFEAEDKIFYNFPKRYYITKINGNIVNSKYIIKEISNMRDIIKENKERRAKRLAGNKQIIPEFRKGPIPYTGFKYCGSNNHLHSGFIRTQREISDPYYGKYSRKYWSKNKRYGSYRDIQKSWKKNSKCKKQYMKNKPSHKQQIPVSVLDFEKDILLNEEIDELELLEMEA